MRKGRVRLISQFSPCVFSLCRAMTASCCSIIASALLSFPGFSIGRSSVAESKATLGEPSESGVFLFPVHSDVPADWYSLCNYLQVCLLHSGGVGM